MGYLDIALIFVSLGLIIFSVVNKKLDKKIRIIIGGIAGALLIGCLVMLALTMLLISAIP